MCAMYWCCIRHSLLCILIFKLKKQDQLAQVSLQYKISETFSDYAHRVLSVSLKGDDDTSSELEYDCQFIVYSQMGRWAKDENKNKGLLDQESLGSLCTK